MRAFALGVALLMIWAVIICGCVGVRIVKLLSIKRREEQRYFARLAKRHRSRGARALDDQENIWVTPPPPNTPRPGESIVEQLLDWYRQHGMPPDESEKAPPRLFDPAQVETLLAFGGAEMHPRGALGNQHRLQKAEKAAKHARGGLSPERAARASTQELKLGTSALKTWLEKSAIAVRIAEDATESARERVLEEETFTERLSGRRHHPWFKEKKPSRARSQQLMTKPTPGIKQMSSVKLEGSPREAGGDAFKSHRGGEPTRDRPERQKHIPERSPKTRTVALPPPPAAAAEDGKAMRDRPERQSHVPERSPPPRPKIPPPPPAAAEDRALRRAFGDNFERVKGDAPSESNPGQQASSSKGLLQGKGTSDPRQMV